MQKKTLIITIIIVLIIIISIVFIVIIYPKLNKKGNNPTNTNVQSENENSIQTNNDVETPDLEETPNVIETEKTENPIPNNDEKNSMPKASPKLDVKPTTSSQSSTTDKNNSTSTATTKTTPTPVTVIEEKPSPTVVETPKQEEIKRCTNVNNHGMDVGNSGKWFNTQAEAVAYYDSKTLYWGTKWENFEIDDATYDANCPSRL